MPRNETLGQRIRRVRQERGFSLARVSGDDFSRAFLNQVELGRSQPSTRVLRVIAGRLGGFGKPPGTDQNILLVGVDSPGVRAAVRAVEAGFGKAPVFIREGGSIPVVGLRCPNSRFWRSRCPTNRPWPFCHSPT